MFSIKKSMPRKYAATFTKKVINEKSFLAVKLGKTITSKETKVLRAYLVEAIKNFTFEEAAPEE